MSLSPVSRRAKTVARRSLGAALRQPLIARIAQRTVTELNHALIERDTGIYGSSYFGADRDPLDRMGLSGYERYDRDSSNANSAAYMIWRYFPVKHTLDVGCATGFVVEALRELGLDSWGTDISHYAVDRPAQGAQGRLEWGDLMAGLPYKDGQFELLSCFEVLEHMEPEKISTVIKEIARVAEKYVICTIPSFGPNEFGPGGWFQVKVRDELVDSYYAKGRDYEGPIPYDDLYRDATGQPIEGHLTIAAFSWWQRQFEAAGLVRCGRTELQIHPHLARFGLTKYWNLYVFRKPTAKEPLVDVRTDADIKHWEHNFKLDERVALPEDEQSVAEALARHP